MSSKYSERLKSKVGGNAAAAALLTGVFTGEQQNPPPSPSHTPPLSADANNENIHTQPGQLSGAIIGDGIATMELQAGRKEASAAQVTNSAPISSPSPTQPSTNDANNENRETQPAQLPGAIVSDGNANMELHSGRTETTGTQVMNATSSSSPQLEIPAEIVRSHFHGRKEKDRLFFYIENELVSVINRIEELCDVRPSEVANAALEYFLPAIDSTGVKKWQGDGKYTDHHVRVGWLLNTSYVKAIHDAKSRLETDKSSIVNNAIRAYLTSLVRT